MLLKTGGKESSMSLVQNTKAREGSNEMSDFDVIPLN